MDQLANFFFGDTVTHYVEQGFSNREAEAMTWIAQQKPKGKFLGLATGGFLAFAWGHWHDRIFAHFGLKCSRIYTQAAIIAISLAFGDYLFCRPRYGANELFANWLFVNNNLFMGNMQSLVQNFQVLNRKFTEEEVKTFNQRAKAFKSNIPLEKRKWIFNPQIETKEEFERRRKLNLTAPWEDLAIRQKIREENPDRDVVYGPKELGQLIDQSGQKLGISRKWEFGWRPL